MGRAIVSHGEGHHEGHHESCEQPDAPHPPRDPPRHAPDSDCVFHSGLMMYVLPPSSTATVAPRAALGRAAATAADSSARW